MGVVSASTQLHNLPQVQIESSPNFKLGIMWIIINHMPFCGFEEALYLRMRMLLPYSLYDLAHSYRLRPAMRTDGFSVGRWHRHRRERDLGWGFRANRAQNPWKGEASFDQIKQSLTQFHQMLHCDSGNSNERLIVLLFYHVLAIF